MSGYKCGTSTLLDKSVTSSSWSQFVDGFLQGIPNAFINTNTGWQYTDSAVEYVNSSATSSNNNTAIRTRQIYNSNSGYYIRFWFTSSFNGSGSNYSDLRLSDIGVKSTEFDNTSITSTSPSYFYYKNLSGEGHTSSKYRIPFFCFSVNKSAIGVDYGSDLKTLSGVVSLSGAGGALVDGNTTNGNAFGSPFYSHDYTFIAISNSSGNQFALGYYRSNAPTKMNLCLAGNILENFDTSDINNFGIFNKPPLISEYPHTSTATISNTWSSSTDHITLFTKNGDQIRDNLDKYAESKINYTPKVNSNYNYINYTKIVLSVDSVENPSWEKISNGQPVKGWLDSSFVRYIGAGNYSSDILKTYDNGNFIQIADGYLLGWDPSNSSLS